MIKNKDSKEACISRPQTEYECDKNSPTGENSVIIEPFCERMDEHLTITWAEFQKNVEVSFGEAKFSQDFADVTLVGEDYKLEAHRLVLSSGSNFFQQLLKKTRHPHPLLYLKGSLKTNIEAILSFLYTGEAKVGQNNLEEFITTAKELKIKGVLDEEESTQRKMTPEKIPENKLLLNSSGFPQSEDINDKSEDIDDKSSIILTTRRTTTREYKKSSVRSYFNECSSNSSKCKLCGKEVQTKSGNTTGLWRHMEISHEDSEVRKGMEKIRRKEHSLVWGYFHRISDDRSSAMCSICQRLVGLSLNFH